MNSKGGITKKLFELAYNRRFAAIEGSWFGAWGLEAALWNILVFRKIRSALGGRVRGMLSGGAPLSGDTQRFMNICFGYDFLVQFQLLISFQTHCMSSPQHHLLVIIVLSDHLLLHVDQLVCKAMASNSIFSFMSMSDCSSYPLFGRNG